ncbi:glycosyltransferase family 2 protein [Rhodoferax sp.]|uniref:glycosyltransferase family 2 protein n=1 Tax=Rhodoferax sp. TaxID=50421 RepID=UPI002634D9E9|nr:glycosyltransferase family 2 protein [Rhodoferax sp.]MDD2808226.1 glycosyltransferase family 2 protein [Rhodoferax sp.]MDD4941981.1 glycosyltransferase family 2 protein [Rhodoferax sp.]MDD5480349.1 glycosyltransferase family 2 protein [Rhodoferax sp.]
MSFLQQISVLILTYNEAPNIGRTLDALKSFPEVVLLDSGSTDDTLAIAAGYINVRVCCRQFDSHSAQWQYGLTACGIEKKWVLALDADYQLPPQLVDEIGALSPSSSQSGFYISFRYCVFGKPLTATLYPPLIALYKRHNANYIQEGHTQRVVVTGEIGRLTGLICHDDRKQLSRWLAAQAGYAVLEAKLLRSSSWQDLKLQDKIRRLIFIAPWLVPLYCLTVGRGFMDGRAGLFYAMQRAVAESILAIQLLETELRGNQ